MSDLAQQVIDAADDIMGNIDNDDAYEFAESVKEKAQSIQTTMISMADKGISVPTPNQETALQNMLSGANRWLENQRD